MKTRITDYRLRFLPDSERHYSMKFEFEQPNVSASRKLYLYVHFVLQGLEMGLSESEHRYELISEAPESATLERVQLKWKYSPAALYRKIIGNFC